MPVAVVPSVRVRDLQLHRFTRCKPASGEHRGLARLVVAAIRSDGRHAHERRRGDATGGVARGGGQELGATEVSTVGRPCRLEGPVGAGRQRRGLVAHVRLGRAVCVRDLDGDGLPRREVHAADEERLAGDHRAPVDSDSRRAEEGRRARVPGGRTGAGDDEQPSGDVAAIDRPRAGDRALLVGSHRPGLVAHAGLGRPGVVGNRQRDRVVRREALAADRRPRHPPHSASDRSAATAQTAGSRCPNRPPGRSPWRKSTPMGRVRGTRERRTTVLRRQSGGITETPGRERRAARGLDLRSQQPSGTPKSVEAVRGLVDMTVNSASTRRLTAGRSISQVYAAVVRGS